MLNSELQWERLKELQRLLEEEDLSRLTRRMLDLFTDTDLPVELRKSTIRLRAAYNAYAILEQAEASEEKRQELLERAQSIIEEIARKIPGTSTEASSQPTLASNTLGTYNPGIIFEGREITKVFQSSRYLFELPQLDMSLKVGEITGVVGENGNGKTTLLRIVAGELEPTSGNLAYPMFDAKPGDWYRIKQHIAYIPQQLPIWRGFLKENLHFTAAIHGIRGKANEDIVDFIIHRLGLSQYEEALWGEISSGFKLRFELARALVWKPRLLIIDEPLANLDINTQQVFLQDLRYLARSTRNPMSILLSSQHLHEVERIADNIIFIKNGEALYNGKMQDFGSDRHENLFELSTTSRKSEILMRLAHVAGIKVEDFGQVKVIRTAVDVDANAVLSELVKADIPVGYFRDISTSTLKLFRRNAPNPASRQGFSDEVS